MYHGYEHNRRLRSFQETQTPTGEEICRHLGCDMDGLRRTFLRRRFNFQIDENFAVACLHRAANWPATDEHLWMLVMLDGFGDVCRRSQQLFLLRYARSDKKIGRGTDFGKLVANLITVAGADRLLTIDCMLRRFKGSLISRWITFTPPGHDWLLPAIVAEPDSGGAGHRRSEGRARMLSGWSPSWLFATSGVKRRMSPSVNVVVMSEVAAACRGRYVRHRWFAHKSDTG